MNYRTPPDTPIRPEDVEMSSVVPNRIQIRYRKRPWNNAAERILCAVLDDAIETDHNEYVTFYKDAAQNIAGMTETVETYLIFHIERTVISALVLFRIQTAWRTSIDLILNLTLSDEESDQILSCFFHKEHPELHHFVYAREKDGYDLWRNNHPSATNT